MGTVEALGDEANRYDDGPQLPHAEGVDHRAPLPFTEHAVQGCRGDPALLQEPRQLLDMPNALA